MRSRRRFRLCAILILTVAATALIGFGGLAAWQATTENDGSTFQTGTVHHTNLAKVGGAGAGVSCTDLTSPGACGVIFTLANARPGSSTTGTVQITHTGTLASTFSLALVSAVVSGSGATLCGNLQVTIVDNESTPATVYTGALSTMPTQSLKSTTGSATWNATNTGTFTFTVSLPNSSPSSDQGSTCTIAYSWTQTNT